MGKQKVGSQINGLGQILVGLPCALLLAFWLKLGVEGLVVGGSSEHVICGGRLAAMSPGSPTAFATSGALELHCAAMFRCCIGCPQIAAQPVKFSQR